MHFKEKLIEKHLYDGNVKNPSEMCFCRGCGNFMARRDVRRHIRRACKRTDNENLYSLLNEKMLNCVKVCRNITLFILWSLRPIVSKDVAKMIAIKVYESRYNMLIWYPVVVRSQRRIQYKKKKIKYSKWHVEIL